MRKRREMAEFSLSFLDVICCGFGAVILLLMITKTVQPQIIEASTVNLEGLVAELQEQLFEIRGETRILNRDLNARRSSCLSTRSASPSCADSWPPRARAMTACRWRQIPTR
jgi:hypothetical protein